jgi:hypothetical protein
MPRLAVKGNSRLVAQLGIEVIYGQLQPEAPAKYSLGHGKRYYQKDCFIMSILSKNSPTPRLAQRINIASLF